MNGAFVLLLAVGVCFSLADAMKPPQELDRRKYIVGHVKDSGVRCRRSLDISLGGKPITKSFQLIHESLKEWVDFCCNVDGFPEPGKVSGPHTREFMIKQKEQGKLVRQVRNTNKFFHPTSVDCNFSAATLSFVLCDGTVIGGDTLISNGFQDADFVDDSGVKEAATRVFSSSMFKPENIDKDIFTLLVGRDLVTDETYSDTELQIINRLFGKNGSFFEILTSVFIGDGKNISDLRVIALHIHTKRVPCGLCGPLLIALSNAGIPRVCSQLDGKNKDFILEGIAKGKIKFLLEVSSAENYTSYGLIYSCCDGVTKHQYMDKVPTLLPIEISLAPTSRMLPMYWHPFDLKAASYRHASDLEAISGNRVEKRTFTENLGYCDDKNPAKVNVAVQEKADVQDIETQTVPDEKSEEM